MFLEKDGVWIWFFHPFRPITVAVRPISSGNKNKALNSDFDGRHPARRTAEDWVWTSYQEMYLPNGMFWTNDPIKTLIRRKKTFQKFRICTEESVVWDPDGRITIDSCEKYCFCDERSQNEMYFMAFQDTQAVNTSRHFNDEASSIFRRLSIEVLMEGSNCVVLKVSMFYQQKSQKLWYFGSFGLSKQRWID